MQIGLARPRKSTELSSHACEKGTVLLEYGGGEMLDSFLLKNYVGLLFLFTPKLSDLVAAITEESDFNTPWCKIKF